MTKLVTLLAGCAVVSACGQPATQPLAATGPQPPLAAASERSLLTYDDRGGTGSVAIGAEGTMTIGPRCTYLAAYDRRILLLWPRSLSSLLPDGSIAYAGGTIRNGQTVSLRGPLHFDRTPAARRPPGLRLYALHVRRAGARAVLARSSASAAAPAVPRRTVRRGREGPRRRVQRAAAGA